MGQDAVSVEETWTHKGQFLGHLDLVYRASTREVTKGSCITNGKGKGSYHTMRLLHSHTLLLNIPLTVILRGSQPLSSGMPLISVKVT